MLHKLFLVTSLVFGCSSMSFADIFVSEPFNYESAGDLSGQGAGSIGFSGNWSGHNSFDVAAGSLTAPVSFPPSLGNRMTADAFDGNREVLRTLSQPLGADNSTVFMSFLMQAEDVVGAGAYNGWFALMLRGPQGNITIGKESFSNQYKIESSSGHISLSNYTIVTNQTHLFVLRADFLPAADHFRLYIDPPTGGSEPISSSAAMNVFDLGAVDTIGLSGPGAFGFDELKIGTTWLDVAPKLAGDYNVNGVVDAADYTVWRNTIGSESDLRADGSGPGGTPDHVIDELDYAFWKARYAETRGSGESASHLDAIPEPTTATVAFLAILIAAIQSTRRREAIA